MAQCSENENGEMAESDRHQFQYTPRMLVLYFALAFAITWVILIPALSSVPEDRQMPFFVLGAFGPFLSAIIAIWTNKGWVELRQWLRQVFRLRIPVVLHLAGAFFLPIGIGVLQYGLYRVLGGEPDFQERDPRHTLACRYKRDWQLYPDANGRARWAGYFHASEGHRILGHGDCPFDCNKG